MGYERNERKAISNLSEQTSKFFNILKAAEKGQMVAIPELCACLKRGPEFVTFSCLSGDQEKKILGENLGTLFTDRKIKVVRQVFKEHYLTVIIDDTEPVRIWQWDTPQEEVTGWYQLVFEESIVPEGWTIKLWSEIERASGVIYEKIITEIAKPEYALVVYHRLEHMKQFPNKKLKWVRDLHYAAILRVAQYALQGIILEKKFPSAILLQGETPWAVKDPLFQTLRDSPLPIIHPFEERR